MVEGYHEDFALIFQKRPRQCGCSRKKAGLEALVIWTQIMGTAWVMVTQLPEAKLVVICNT